MCARVRCVRTCTDARRTAHAQHGAHVHGAHAHAHVRCTCTCAYTHARLHDREGDGDPPAAVGEPADAAGRALDLRGVLEDRERLCGGRLVRGGLARAVSLEVVLVDVNGVVLCARGGSVACAECVHGVCNAQRVCTARVHSVCARRVCTACVHGACAQRVCTARVHSMCARRVCAACAHACMSEASRSSVRLLIWRRYSSSFSTWWNGARQEGVGRTGGGSGA